MRIAVGSENPVKKSATEQALGRRFDARVVAVAVDSGVPEQPTGHEETRTGAANRATAARSATDATFGVGIEGGVAEFEGSDDLFLVMWAAVTDGVRWGHGSGPSLQLPDHIASRVRDGEELGPVMDDVLGMDDVARKQGAAGVLTDKSITRESALAHAVSGAFGPFVTDLY